MGVSMSAPQLGNGLVTIVSGSALVFSTAFRADQARPTDSVGFLATVVEPEWFNYEVMSATYTDLSSVQQTASCTASTFTSTTITSTATAVVSVLCDMYNFNIGNGPMTMSFYDAETSFAIYMGETTSTVTDASTTFTPTVFLPGSTSYMTTATTTSYTATEHQTTATTLTGDISTSYCTPSSTTPLETTTSQTTVQTTTSETTTLQTTTLQTTPSLQTTPPLPTTTPVQTTTSKSSTTAKLSTTTAKSSTTSNSSTKSSVVPTTTSRSTTSSRRPSTSTSIKASSSTTFDALLATLEAHPVIAQPLCTDFLAARQTFPSSISVWPATQLSSACSHYERILSAGTAKKVARQAQVTTTQAPTTTTTAATTTSTIPASVAGYEPPIAYAISTTTVFATDSTTVYSYTTVYADETTATVYATTTETQTDTVDMRTSATTCVTSSSPSPKAKRFARRSTTCSTYKLETALIYVEMSDPMQFCKYFLSSTNRVRSPLAGVDAATVYSACRCILQEGGSSLPKATVSALPGSVPKTTCNTKYAATIKKTYKQTEEFCSFWNAVNRSETFIPGMTAAQIYAGCKCV